MLKRMLVCLNTSLITEERKIIMYLWQRQKGFDKCALDVECQINEALPWKTCVLLAEKKSDSEDWADLLTAEYANSHPVGPGKFAFYCEGRANSERRRITASGPTILNNRGFLYHDILK